MKKQNKKKTGGLPELKDPNITSTSDSKIKLSDPGTKSHAVFLNKERKKYLKFLMDGGLVVNETCADWMLARDHIGNVVVELKGGDVHHAMKQVHAATKFAKENGLLRGGKVAGLVICTQHPAIDTKIQRARNEYQKLYNGPLHSKSGGCGEFEFERVLSFDGPDGSVK